MEATELYRTCSWVHKIFASNCKYQYYAGEININKTFGLASVPGVYTQFIGTDKIRNKLSQFHFGKYNLDMGRTRDEKELLIKNTMYLLKNLLVYLKCAHCHWIFYSFK